MSFLKNFSRIFFTWQWIQLELTSFCNGRCFYCPHRIYFSSWRSRHFPLERFLNLVKTDFYSTRMLHLQGWGEPFLHPQFFEFLRAAKREKFFVGTTTNATLLNKNLIKRLIHEGLDLISFSLAGVEKNNDFFREGTSFKKVLWSIETFQKYKEAGNSLKPYVHIAYMWLRSALKDLLFLPEYLKELNVRQVVVHTLTFVPECKLQSEVIYFEDEEAVEIAKESIKLCKEIGIEMRVYLPLRKKKVFSCPEFIDRALFINSCEEVSPCVLFSVPIEGKTSYCFENKSYTYEKKTFGNVTTQSLKEIWRQKEYKEFRKNFYKFSFCQRCYKPLLEEVL